MRQSYQNDHEQKIFDLIVYFKYYLPQKEYKIFIEEIYTMLSVLEQGIHPNAFANIRGKIGIRNLDDLQILEALSKPDINYNSFDK